MMNYDLRGLSVPMPFILRSISESLVGFASGPHTSKVGPGSHAPVGSLKYFSQNLIWNHCQPKNVIDITITGKIHRISIEIT